MKQVAQNYRSGELVVLDAPVPACKPGGVLVRTLYSLISTGTELMKVTEARLSLVGKARARPDQVRKVLDSVAQQGPVATYKKVTSTLDSYTPLGYSLCGVVVEVGAGAEEFAVGDLVAAAGNEFALHAELNWVPTNLCVPVPQGVAGEHAAFATVGAIAMQGVRRGEPQLGETACVIGLGLVGQLVVRLLLAAGLRVVGIDTVPERCRLAEQAGALACGGPDADGTDYVEQVLRTTTNGLGADQVYLAAGGDTNGPVELAVRLSRDRGRVVDIGKTRLDLPWNAFYEKEIDVRFSRSYGPGRYDDRYELDGVDYPPAYVRWTERRNLGSFLDLVARGAVDVGPLVSGVHPIGEAAHVYTGLRDGSLRGIGFLFEYPDPEDVTSVEVPAATGSTGGHEQPTAHEPTRNGSSNGRPHTATPVRSVRAVPRVPARPAADGTGSPARVRLGFIGAGSYATSMLLPHLVKDPGVTLARVATTRSLSAVNAQRKFGFQDLATDADAVLGDPAVDAVFVVTRHHSHAAFVCRALEAGKAVFVEKPLALTESEVDRVLDVVARTGNDRVMVGFNRRFAPLFCDMRRRFGTPRGPMSIRYLVNAGRLDASSWYLDEQLEGSRFLGEGGHFIDTLSAWIGGSPVEVVAHQTSDGLNLEALLRYDDGSLATIAYDTDGDSRFPKETLDVTGSGRNARLDNFTRATVWSRSGRSVKRSLAGQDKGQRAELAAFVEAVRTGGPMPIGLDSLVATTRATMAVDRSLALKGPVVL
ncbi:bi-domain-containing oxidoreductase [Intrasporangium sp. YIM S08009]|uniref:bi-domain-containing oxidoreductase n=1 Tax=Intrasporangium zincisolvens TaxID=3080018 RepID=UPI002B0571B3|nr:bi-domain-containing oxidoreductase [Intrasporangium sp. YIM S08009]